MYLLKAVSTTFLSDTSGEMDADGAKYLTFSGKIYTSTAMSIVINIQHRASLLAG
jgi:hypothetical protein